MYYPYFRGKQYELIAIRENAKLMADHAIVPIIEPVKQNTAGLKRTIDALVKNNTSFVLIKNPHCGELQATPDDIPFDSISDYPKCAAGVISGPDCIASDIKSLLEDSDFSSSVIHAGFPNATELAAALEGLTIKEHVFFEGDCGKRYQRNFKSGTRILLRDGFEKRKNREHPDVEHFSDLHLTYEDEGMNGYGDFLVVGDDYSEQGGPAYAVAIHITFCNPNEEDDMYIKHYKSDRQDTPVDPAGKFFEALTKLVDNLDSEDSMIFESTAIKEFRDLHSRRHYPGLGYVKKLSMQHHLELMANFLENR